MNQTAAVQSIKQFIAIDDDQAILFMCKVIIQRTFKDMMVVTYPNPQMAVDYFNSQFAQHPVETVVLLDINMPQLSGWEVLDSFFVLGDDIKKYITVIMLSSSIDSNDKRRAIDHPCVINYLEKPLTVTKFNEVMKSFQAEMTL